MQLNIVGDALGVGTGLIVIGLIIRDVRTDARRRRLRREAAIAGYRDAGLGDFDCEPPAYDGVMRKLGATHVAMMPDGSFQVGGTMDFAKLKDTPIAMIAGPYGIAKFRGRWYVTKGKQRLRCYTRKFTALTGARRANLKYAREQSAS